MPQLSDAAKNVALDAIAAVYDTASLHTAYSATGANEVTGGSPAYARKPITWNPASGGAIDADPIGPFDVPAGTTVAWLGLWDAPAGTNFGGMIPLGATTDPMPFTATDSGDLFTVDAHGFSNGQTVVFFDVGAASALPTGITEGTIYYVINVSGDTFQVSTTSGGSAVTLTSDGAGVVQKITPETFTGQGTHTVTDADLLLRA